MIPPVSIHILVIVSETVNDTDIIQAHNGRQMIAQVIVDHDLQEFGLLDCLGKAQTKLKSQGLTWKRGFVLDRKGD